MLIFYAIPRLSSLMSRGACSFFVTLEAADSGFGWARQPVENYLVLGPDRLALSALLVLPAAKFPERQPMLAAGGSLLATFDDRSAVAARQDADGEPVAVPKLHPHHPALADDRHPGAVERAQHRFSPQPLDPARDGLVDGFGEAVGLFQGKKPHMPFVDPPSLKRAKREDTSQQGSLL